MKRGLSIALAAAFLFPTLTTLGGCARTKGAITLRVYNWEEYIDEGGEGSYVYDMLAEEGGEPDEADAPSIIDDFEAWYEETYGEAVHVEYATFGTNEDMYNELQLGNSYDLICPSDYMIMKLAAEDRLEKYDEEFFDKSVEENYYVRNVSPFILEKFQTNGGLATRDCLWSDYAAGYMWGTTGFVYNPQYVSESDLDELGWHAFTDARYKGKITAKDNVRDTYFAALGVAYEDELLALDPAADNYQTELTRIFNATDEETVANVYPILLDIKKNIYSFETDTGKADLVNGNIWLNYAWSGDAVYALNLAESGEDEDGDKTASVLLDYYVPKAGTNLWFDGWVMPKGANKKAAQAFVNFLSKPENAIRNSYYIGYTSVIAGENNEMLDYAKYLYEAEEDAEDTVEYDLSYFFFGDDVSILADRTQATRRQLYAQFPSAEAISHCAVMDYYRDEANVRINELWSRVKAETLDAWAIIVICVTVVAIALFIVFVKFGGKIDFFRRKPKEGYVLVKQVDADKPQDDA